MSESIERKKFDKWYLETFDIQIEKIPNDSLAHVIYSSLWNGWLARSKEAS